MKEGWEVKKLGELSDFYRGLTYSKQDEVEHSNNAVLRSNNINLTTNTLDLKELKYISDAIIIPENKKVKKGDLMICTANGSKSHLGKIALIDSDYDYAYGGFMGIIRPNKKVDSKYLFYSMISPSYKDYINSLSDGVNINNLKYKELSQFEVSLPIDLSEQCRIVEKLNGVFRKIDDLKRNAEQNLANSKALFQQALTYELSPKGGWRTTKFSELCDFVRGPFGGSLKKSCFVEEGYAVYEQQNAIYDKYDFRYYITQEKFNEMRRFEVFPNDILMSCSGTFGKISIVPKGAQRGIINQALLKLTPKQEVDVGFLKFYMESELFQNNLTTKGAAIQNVVSVKILKEINLQIPCVDIQKKIASKLNIILRKCTDLEENIKRVERNCEAMKKAILTKAFNGEL